MPGMDLDRDTWLVADGNDAPVAFGLVQGVHPEHSQDSFIRVHPGHLGRGIGGYVLDAVETRAKERAPASGRQAVLWASGTATDRAASALLSSRGFDVARHFWHMERELGEEPVPEPPPGITTRTFRRGQDERLAHALMEESFEMVGVRKPRRGRGIGTFLLRRAFADLARRGHRRARLNVDAGNETGATRLYERVGMRVRREFLVYEKRLER